jgi:hypothetical protein
MLHTDGTQNHPYKECFGCKTLEDCPHPDVVNDGLGSPFIPDCCPRPMEVMKATLKKHKTTHKLIREN